jgi:hypothetical protein
VATGPDPSGLVGYGDTPAAQAANLAAVKQQAASQGKVVVPDANGHPMIVDQGVPADVAKATGITTGQDYQIYAQQQIAQQQMDAQQQIAQQQEDFNTKQLQAQQDLQARQEQAAADQAQRQSVYNQGQASQLRDASQQINDAFGMFSPDYFKQYAQDYMTQVGDQLGYQRQQADKQMKFGLSRQGLSDSQELANQTGILDEAEGAQLSQSAGTAQSQAAQLQQSILQQKQGLLQQVADAQSVGPPIATSSLGDVNNALNTQQQRISGIANSAGDVIAATKGVPTVSPLGNIFAGLIGSTSSYLGGTQAQNALTAYRNAAGLNASNPGGTSRGNSSTSLTSYPSYA